jgi:hypothetical protein
MRQAFEAAGIQFTNGDGSGVRHSKADDSDALASFT